MNRILVALSIAVCGLVLSAPPAAFALDVAEAISLYNQGVDLYREGKTATAADKFRQAATSDDPVVATRARYNLGNTFYRDALERIDGDAAEPQAAIKLLEAAVESYRSALSVDPSDDDPRANLELAVRLIDQLRQQADPQPPEQPTPPESNSQPPQQPSDRPQQPPDSQPPDESQQSPSEPTQQSSNQNGSEENANESPPSTNDSARADAEEREPQERDTEERDEGKQSGGETSDSESPSADRNSNSSRNQSADSEAPPSEPESPQPDPNEAPSDSSAGDENRSPPELNDPPASTGRAGSDAADRDPKRADQERPGTESEAGNPAPSADPLETPPAIADGELRSDAEQDAPQPPSVSVATPPQPGMTEQEARKLLQAIRDRDLLRRERRGELRRSSRIRVEKDW